MRKANILELTTTLGVGGTENVVSLLSRGLSREKYNVMVACLDKGGLLADELKQDGIEVHPLNAKGKLDLTIVPKLVRLLKTREIDILHTYLFHANFIGRICGKLAGVPVRISSERIMGMEPKYRLVLNRLTAGLCDAFTANSEAVKRFMVESTGLKPEKIVVIHNGIDTREYNISISKEDERKELGLGESPVVGMVSRLDRQKGHQYFIESAKIVLMEKQDTQFLIVGDGPLRKELESQVKELGISESVSFLGTRRDIPEILRAMDIFVLSSLWEGLPNVVMEAMASSLPVIATDVCGTPELVADGETGILVEAEDAKGMADAVLELLKNKTIAENMGKMGRKRVEAEFSLKLMIKKNENLYDNLLKK